MWHDNTHTNSYSLHNIHTHTFHPFVCVCLFVFIASFRFDFVIPMHTDGFVSGRRCALGALFRSHCRIASARVVIDANVHFTSLRFFERKITSITTIANIIYFDRYNANCKFSSFRFESRLFVVSSTISVPLVRIQIRIALITRYFARNCSSAAKAIKLKWKIALNMILRTGRDISYH